jgi:hypothetical protein
MASKDLIWVGPAGLSIPHDFTKPQQIITVANGLTIKQKSDIARAFENQAYDMGAEYTWRRSMIRLKSSLKSLGMSFIGEMLGDEDIDEYSNIEMVLNDYNAISLAEHLGAISATGALKLRQALEMISHYLSDKAEKDGEELSLVDAAQIVSTCVKYILGDSEISIAIEFSELRKRLLKETIPLDDPQIVQLLESPVFYLKTVIAVLVAAVKNEKGAGQEHAVGNLSNLIQPMWTHIAEKDRWQIGNAYRDVTSAGNINAAKGLKNALLKVKGFDYVPENLRSTTFKKAAKAVLEAHFGSNNFYTEGPLVANLSKLGSSIPAPAFIECVQAYLCVFLGNPWGHAFASESVAERELKKIPGDRWEYYFGKVIQNDEVVLPKLLSSKPRDRLCTFVRESLSDLHKNGNLTGDNRKLLEALDKNDVGRITAIAEKMYRNLSAK